MQGSKLFAAGELLARLLVALRHAAAGVSGEPTFTVAGLRVDQVKRQVQIDGRDVHLTRSSTASSPPWSVMPAGC